MQIRFAHLFFLLVALSAAPLRAAVLGRIPTVEKENLRFIFDWRSDLWTSPYQDKNTPMRIYNVDLRAPVLKVNGWQGSLEGQTESLNAGKTGVTVGNKGILVDTDLRSDALGFAITRDNEDKSSFSFFGSYNSAGDDPYKAGRDIWVDLRARYAFAPQGDHQWLILLDQDKNRGYWNGETIPLVGVINRLSDEYLLTVGFPFLRLNWKDQDRDTFEYMLTPVGTNAEYVLRDVTRVSYRFKAGFSTRSYLHTSREEDSMRLIYEEKYLETGVRLQATENTRVGLTFGYSFDRNLYEAKQVFLPIGPRTGLGRDIYGGAHWEFTL